MKLRVGESLLDMHDGLHSQLDDQLREMVTHLSVGVNVSDQLVDKAKADSTSGYLNKMLTLVDIDEHSGLRTFAYSYDGRRGGIVTFGYKQ